MTQAYVMTYDNLVSDVIKYMERNDQSFVDQIPSLIGLSEQALAAELKTLLQLNVVETTLLAGQYILQKPARWRKTISFKSNGQPLYERTQDILAQYTAESSNGVPLYYGSYDYQNWMIAPAPAVDTPIEIIYYSLVSPLSSDNQQNLFTQYAPQALLFGTLLQAQGYLKNQDKLNVWKQYYTDAINAIKGEDKARSFDRNTTALEP